MFVIHGSPLESGVRFAPKIQEQVRLGVSSYKTITGFIICICGSCFYTLSPCSVLGRAGDTSITVAPALPSGLTVQVGKTDQSLENDGPEWSGLGWKTPEARMTQHGGQGGLPGGGAIPLETWSL